MQASPRVLRVNRNHAMPLVARTFFRDVPKLFPLTISRGTSGTTRNLFVEVSDGTHTGLGEGAPPTGLPADFAETAGDHLAPLFAKLDTLDLHALNQLGHELEIEAVALAALDGALWDLKAKQAGMPLFRLLGLPKPTAVTSVTMGIEPPEVVRERVPKILNLTGAKSLKVKLGSPGGRDHDKEIWSISREMAAPFGAKLRADANGGWTPDEAVDMMRWLRDHDCEYIEQPLVKGSEDDLPLIFAHRALPIYLDESVRVARDVIKVADRCDGVNLKLMKSGGITEGLALLATARAHGLKTMIGCMCETTVGIAMSAAISGLCDMIDLDTHLNHDPDPAAGVDWIDGIVMPQEVPGHGGYLM